MALITCKHVDELINIETQAKLIMSQK